MEFSAWNNVDLIVEQDSKQTDITQYTLYDKRLVKKVNFIN